jgi:hypothetical protein
MPSVPKSCLAKIDFLQEEWSGTIIVISKVSAKAPEYRSEINYSTFPIRIHDRRGIRIIGGTK